MLVDHGGVGKKTTKKTPTIAEVFACTGYALYSLHKFCKTFETKTRAEVSSYSRFCRCICCFHYIFMDILEYFLDFNQFDHQEFDLIEDH